MELGLNPVNPDTDLDGINDGDEDIDGDGILGPQETHPRLADSDGGGESDGSERAAGRDPLDASDDNPQGIDSDGDGLSQMNKRIEMAMVKLMKTKPILTKPTPMATGYRIVSSCMHRPTR